MSSAKVKAVLIACDECDWERLVPIVATESEPASFGQITVRFHLNFDKDETLDYIDHFFKEAPPTEKRKE